MIHIMEFESGGFVAHKIRIEGSNRRFSAWFDKSGTMTNCEGIDSCNRTGRVSDSQKEDIKRHYAIAVKIEEIRNRT